MNRSGLDAGDLFFLDLEEFVDFADVVVGELLDFLQGVAFGVFRYRLVLQHFLQTMVEGFLSS